jgi:phage terminase small subunit
MKRGRKSEAELVALSVVRPRIGADRETASHDRPEPPGHLSTATKAWWNGVLQDYEVQDHALRTLQAIAEAWDRKEEARKALAKHGLTYTDDHGMVRPRPEVQIERNAMTTYFRGLRELNLKVEPPHGYGLQPAGLFR